MPYELPTVLSVTSHYENERIHIKNYNNAKREENSSEKEGLTMQTATYDSTITAIAERIRDMREIAGFSIEEMAKKTDTTPEQYEAYENGTCDFPFSFLHK